MKKTLIYKILSGLFTIILILTTGFLIYSLFLFSNIETFFRIMASILLILLTITLVYSLINAVKHNKKKKLIISIIFSLILSIITFVVSFYLYKAYIGLDKIHKDEIIYSTSLISLEKYKIDKITDKKIGIISDEKDISLYILPNEVIKKYNLDKSNKIVKYSDLITLMSAFLNKEVDLMFITSNYESKFSNLETYNKNTNIFEITKYEKTYKKKHVEKDTISTNNKITKPFTMLLLGIDSEGEGIKTSSSFNGDTIMLITFDPETLRATMFSIPRDTYVKMACGGRLNKINAASWGGTSCMIKTVENFTGLNIDYYAKINFKGVVDLVDILDGIRIDVPIDFCEQNSDRQFGDKTICLNKGMQTLNGEQALAFARHRKTLPLGDFQRGQHQQMVVEGMIQSLKSVRNVNDFYKILDAISNNMDTNMTTEEMLSMYDVAKNMLLKGGDVNLNITKTFLTGYDLYVYNGSGYTYTFQYYKQSLDDIVKSLKVSLNMVKKEEIKTFDFDLNIPYEKTVIGKTYYNEARKELLPDFTDYSLEGAKSYLSNRGISYEIVTETVSSPGYYDNQIIGQSIHDGVLVETVSSIKLVIVKVEKNNVVEEPEPVKPTDPVIPDPVKPTEPDKPDVSESENTEETEN